MNITSTYHTKDSRRPDSGLINQPEGDANIAIIFPRECILIQICVILTLLWFLLFIVHYYLYLCRRFGKSIHV